MDQQGWLCVVLAKHHGRQNATSVELRDASAGSGLAARASAGGINSSWPARFLQAINVFNKVIIRVSVQTFSVFEQVLGGLQRAHDRLRTFPHHDFFTDSAGIGQENLFNVLKAYSLYAIL